MRFNIEKHTRHPIELDYSVDEVYPSESIDIPYQTIKYPEQPTTKVVSSDEGVEDYHKKMMLEFEEKYLTFNEPDSEPDCIEDEKQYNFNTKDINMTTYPEIENSEIDEKNIVTQRCRSSRRGTKSTRTNYNLRKMRMRAY